MSNRAQGEKICHFVCKLAAAPRHTSAESLASCTLSFPRADTKPVTHFSLLQLLAIMRIINLLWPVRELDPIPAAVFASFKKWLGTEGSWASRPLMKTTLGPLGSRGTNLHGWDSNLVGCCPVSRAWGAQHSGEWPAVPIVSCVEPWKEVSMPPPLLWGKGKFSAGVSLEWQRTGLSLTLQAWNGGRWDFDCSWVTLDSQTSMVSGSGWDGVNGPGSNHYRAVLGTYSYNGVDSTPTFWSCWTGLTQHQGCLFVLHPMASRLEAGKSLWAHIVRTKQRRYFIIKGDILSHVMLYLAKKKRS